MGAIDIRERYMANLQFGSGAITGVDDTGLPVAGLVPGTWYCGLSTTQPNEDGSNFTEPVGMGYLRAQVANTALNFPPARTDGGITTKWNGNLIKFNDPTGLWGNIGWYGWFNTNSTGPTILPQFWNALDTPITVQNGNTPVQFDAGQLIMVWD